MTLLKLYRESPYALVICKLGLKNQNLLSRCLDYGFLEQARALKRIDEHLWNILVEIKQHSYPSRAEQEAAGITHYIWRTQGDGKVRPSHAANNGKIFAWNDPPPTGHPGEDYNCRCVAEPYIEKIINDPPIEPVYPELIFLPLVRFGRIIATLFRKIRSIDADTLNEAQIQNLKRYDLKLPKDAGEIQILKGKNGQRIFRADVPARNIPGSYARYEKIVDKFGNTVSYTKTTYAPDGSVVHIKIK